MRTKTILLSGVVAALSGASLMAQVYSVNVVGYINVTVPTGFSIIADQLFANGQGVPQYLSPLLDSQIGTDGTAPLNQCFIYKYKPGNPGTWATFSPDAYNYPALVWDQYTATNTTLNPGEAIFIQNGSGSAFTITFTGTVPQGNNLTNTALAHGFSLASSIIPQAGRLDVDLGLPEVDGDAVYIFDSVHNQYQYWIGDEYNLPQTAWDNYNTAVLSPTVAVGQGFFYSGGQAAPITVNPGTASVGTATNYSTMWVRSFTVQ